MTKRFASLLLPLSALLAIGLFGDALAQTSGLDVAIREVAFGNDGRTEVTVSVSGTALGSTALSPGDFVVTEAGRRVRGLTASRLVASGTRGISVALLMDVSGSTKGAPIDAAKAAAKIFVGQLPPGVRVAVQTFGETTTTIVPLTADRAALNAGIDRVTTSGERTSLYDGVTSAATLLGRSPNAQHNIIVFSDGNDTASKASLGEAVQRVQSVDAPVSTVLLNTSKIDVDALQTLAEAEDGGRFLNVTDTTGLTDAFARLAQSISSQYVLTYASPATGNIEIGVTVAAGGLTASDESVVFNERTQAGAATTPKRAEPLIGFLSGALGLWLGIGAAFAGVALFLGMLLYRPAGKAAERMLQRGLRMYSRSERKQRRETTEGGLASTAMGRRAIEIAERVPRSEKFDEKMQKQLEQAGWPMRSTEFVLLQLGGAVIGAVLGFGLLQRAWLGLAFMVVGAVVPQLILSNRMNKREAEFLSQLPDTLQLLSGSLQAGYGFLQAIDTVAREANPPTGPEFARVLSEARLGMPLDEALDGMSERVGGEDFKWVVLAINIQRQVGGNLATLLQTVANTLREREQVRRQIKVLSAEGRLSAVILVALPFFLAGYISVVNPKYIGELTGASLGRILIAIALVLMGIGIVWMRKIIKIDV